MGSSDRQLAVRESPLRIAAATYPVASAWEFTAHLFPHGTRWTWSRYHDGEPRQQSPVMFQSYMEAMVNATRCGFTRQDSFALAALTTDDRQLAADG